jgi:hypothetical protein
MLLEHMKANSFTKSLKKGISSSSTDNLLQRLDKLNTLLENQISLPRVFLRGVISGLGNILGATVVMGVVVSLIAWLLVGLVFG